MVWLRRHQQQFVDHIDAIARGDAPSSLCGQVTAGGGKSVLSILATKLEEQNLVDRICVVVPRLSLGDQLVDDFAAPLARALTMRDVRLVAACNVVNPTRGQIGYVTTTQALCLDSAGINRHEFERYRYALIIDEAQHIAAGSSLARALEPLVRLARYVFFLSGNFYRADQRPLAFLPYSGRSDRLRIDESDGAWRHIQYSRTDALWDRAILPIEFHFADGHAKWRRGSRHIQAGRLSAVGAARRKDAIWTALQTGYAHELLNDAVLHWQSHRRAVPGAKLLVIAPSILTARKYCAWLADMNVHAIVATSDEPEAAREAIRRFKALTDDAPQALVTVAMAYEGLNVPAISHIACLTHVRSRPYLEQIFARAVRVDPHAGPYEQQRAHVFAPSDEDMIDAIDAIESEQSQFARQRQQQPFPTPAVSSCRTSNELTAIASHIVGRDGRILGSETPANTLRSVVDALGRRYGLPPGPELFEFAQELVTHHAMRS